jgi:hypothetical protein
MTNQIHKIYEYNSDMPLGPVKFSLNFLLRVNRYRFKTIFLKTSRVYVHNYYPFLLPGYKAYNYILKMRNLAFYQRNSIKSRRLIYYELCAI